MTHHITPAMMAAATDLYFAVRELVHRDEVLLCDHGAHGDWYTRQTSHVVVHVTMAPGVIWIEVARRDRSGQAKSHTATFEVRQKPEHWGGLNLTEELRTLYHAALEMYTHRLYGPNITT